VHLYKDIDGDGTQGGDEPDLEGVQVNITDSLGAAGDASLLVAEGITTVSVVEDTLPPGYVQTQGQEPTEVFVLAGGVQSVVNGYEPSFVLVHTYIDIDGDGTQDDDEENLSGIDVIITDSNNVQYMVATDADGNALVEVPPGNVLVQIIKSDLIANLTQTEGSPSQTVVVDAGETTPVLNGYYPEGQVYVHLYKDTDGNGQQNGDEPNLEGVEVTITDSQGVPRTVTTDANGDVRVPVAAGEATVVVNQDTLPDGYVQTKGEEPMTVYVAA